MSGASPYPGLRSFDRDEADVFFGRDRCLDGMAQTLENTRFLAVLGPSGSGKSSLVRSGLFMHLEAGLAPKAGSRWTFLDIRHPRTQPFRELARATLQCERERQGDGGDRPVSAPDASEDADLDARRQAMRLGPLALVRWWREHPHHPNENLLLMVDQFEELFGYTTPRERDEVEAFIDLLLHSAANEEVDIYVVLTMRSEFLGGCALFPGLAEQINRSLSLTPRMTRDECRSAITGPAYGEALTLEPLLVTTLLNDMNSLAQFDDRSAGHDPAAGDSPGAELRQTDLIARRADQLPLMQHVLNWMWNLAAARRADADAPILLSLQDYLALGGLRGALSRHAHEVMESTGEPELTSRLFRALTDQPTVATSGSAESSAVRRRRTLAQLAEETQADESRVRAVVDAFRAEGVSMLTPEPEVRLTSDMEVDIAHESLIRQWSDLRGWIRDEAEGGRAWQELLRDVGKGKQLRGLDLAERRGWWERAAPHAGWAARYGGGFDSVDGALRADLRAERRRKLVLRTGTGALVAAAALSGLVITDRVSEAVAAQNAARAAGRSAAESQAKAEALGRSAAKARKEAILAASLKAKAEKEAAQATRLATAAAAAAQAAKADAIRRMQQAGAEVERARLASEDVALHSRNLSAIVRDTEYAQLQLAWEKSPDEAAKAFDSAEGLVKALKDVDPAAFAVLQSEVERVRGDYATYRLSTREMTEAARAIKAEVSAPAADSALPAGSLRLAQAETLLGRAAALEGRPDDALSSFQDALKHIPASGPEEFRTALAEVQYERASLLFDQGAMSDAAGAANECLRAAVPAEGSSAYLFDAGSRQEQAYLRPLFARFRCQTVLAATTGSEAEAEKGWFDAHALTGNWSGASADVALARADMIIRYFRRPRKIPPRELPEPIDAALKESFSGLIPTDELDVPVSPSVRFESLYPLIALRTVTAHNEYVKWALANEAKPDLAKLVGIMNATQQMFDAFGMAPLTAGVVTSLSAAYELHVANWIELARRVDPDNFDSLETVVPAKESMSAHWSFIRFTRGGIVASPGEVLGKIRKQAVELVETARRQHRWERFGTTREAARDLLNRLCGVAELPDDESCVRLTRAIAGIEADDARLARSVAASAPRLGRPGERVWADSNGFALAGYDPVVCFDRSGLSETAAEGSTAEPRPCWLRKGRLDFALAWGGRVWLFENDIDRGAFIAARGAQAPRFGGYDAPAVATGRKDLPERSRGQAGTVQGGRLYLTSAYFRPEALTARDLAKAEAAWAKVKAAPDPAAPPSQVDPP